MCRIEVGFGYDFVGRVHGDYRNTRIDGFNVVLGDVFRNGSATADIVLTHVSRLPDDARVRHDAADPCDILCRCIIGTTLPPCPVYLDMATPQLISDTLRLSNTSAKLGSKQAVTSEDRHGICFHGGEIAVPCRGDLRQQVCHEVALHPRIALGADLLLISRNDHGGVEAVVRGEQCSKRRVSAHAVIVPIGTDQRAIQSHVPCPDGGDCGEVGRKKILLGDAVLFVQKGKNIQFDRVLVRAGGKDGCPAED